MRGITVIRQLAQRIGRSKAKTTLNHKQLNLVSKTEQTPWTRTWIHLFELPYRERVKVYHEKDARERYEGLAAVKDRIKQWNIVPGDLVRVRGDRDHTIREVFGVNKFKNRVYFKESQDTPEAELRTAPYSACQLYIGDRQFPPEPGEKAEQTLPVFALRVRSSTAKWSPSLGRYDWIRYAIKTHPSLPNEGRLIIPWPIYERPAPPPINTALDTSEDIVKQITWIPSYVFRAPSNKEAKKHLEDTYLREINPASTGAATPKFDPEVLPPMEYVIVTELSNPHGQTKKLLRARARVENRKLTRNAFIKAESHGLAGRAKKQAIADAEFRWEELRRKEVKDARKRLWIAKGFRKRTLERRERKVKKAQRQLERLQKLQLQDAPNQVSPKALLPA